MKALVTGATGHIGSHVIRACLAAGITPIAFARPRSDRRTLAGLQLDVREGDLLDASSVERAVEGVDLVFHVGAAHRNWAPEEATIIAPAVTGTRNVLEAAKRAGVRRVVYTSTGATVGFSTDPTRPLDESAPIPAARAVYSRAKIEAEQLALGFEGIDVVVVNPSGVFGPLDYRITPATRAIVGLLQGNPSMLGISVTDVRDVATGHVLAASKGRPRTRYLLTGDVLSPKQIAQELQHLAGVRPPVLRPPRFLLRLLAGAAERKARKTGTDAEITRDQVADVFGRHLAYDSRRAKTELGATFRPATDVLRDALRWLLFVDGLQPKVAARVRTAMGGSAAPDPSWLA